MLKRVLLLVFVTIPAAWSLTGCETEPDCAAACRHVCEVCGGASCDESSLKSCEDNCANSQPEGDRVDCILSTDSCDDFWKC